MSVNKNPRPLRIHVATDTPSAVISSIASGHVVKKQLLGQSALVDPKLRRSRESWAA